MFCPDAVVVTGIVVPKKIFPKFFLVIPFSVLKKTRKMTFGYELNSVVDISQHRSQSKKHCV